MASDLSRGSSGHNTSLHRANNSISSNRSSSSGRGSERKSNRSGVESTVTRLLIAIRQLLEALTLWSTEQVTEKHVSDVYVRLGNDFNAAVAAFTHYNIDMSDLISVPADLRSILETCLAEDATPVNLDIYLPQVRSIITSLLQGLRIKQSQYRKLSERRSSKRDDINRDSDYSLSSPNGRRPSDAGILETTEEEQLDSSTQVPAESSISAQTNASPRQASLSVPPPVNPEQPPPKTVYENIPTSSRQPEPVKPTITTSKSYTAPATPPTLNGDDSLRRGRSVPFRREVSEHQQVPAPSIPASQPMLGPEIKRYSLSDRPVSSQTPPPPDVVVHSASNDTLASSLNEGDDETMRIPVPIAVPDTPVDSSQVPEMANSFRALKKSDTLERRASKRFSTYTFQKMTGSRGPAQAGHRRSIIAGSISLTPGDLATLTESDETPGRVTRKSSYSKLSESSARRSKPGSPIAEESDDVPPVPTVSVTDVKSRVEGLPATSTEDVVADDKSEVTQSTIPVFLQVSREVKKVQLEPDISLATMRVLFMDKFAYNPGQENFPAIYIRDPSSGVQYELEDMDEVKPGCLLSLNIEPLDQIKQHIDAQMANLAKDLKELRTAMTSSNRVSTQVIPPVVPQSPVSPTPARPTDKQLRDAARRLSRIHSREALRFQEPPHLQPQVTGTSIATNSEAGSSRIVSDLKVQFDEVQNLRRDLGVMRQVYTSFITQTKDSLSGLREQAQTLRQTASTNVAGARAFIDTGKSKLDSRSQTALTKIEELQDSIENLRDDLLKRHVSPKRYLLKTLKDDIESTSTELESLREQIDNVKPVWKKTWEQELQNIVEEQTFLQHVEELVLDLGEDHKQLVGVYSELEKFDQIRGKTFGSGRGRSFKPPPLEEGHDGISTVMLQIRGAAIDPDKRMRAIEASQRARQKEKEAAAGDEFEEELSGFVKGKKLKMTGGAEEVERVRQRKSEAVLKAMFSDQ